MKLESPWEVWWKKNLPWLCTWKWFETCHCLYLVWLKNKQFEVCTRMDPKPTHNIKKKFGLWRGFFLTPIGCGWATPPWLLLWGAKSPQLASWPFCGCHSHFSWLSLVAQPSWCAWLLWVASYMSITLPWIRF